MIAILNRHQIHILMFLVGALVGMLTALYLTIQMIQDGILYLRPLLEIYSV